MGIGSADRTSGAAGVRTEVNGADGGAGAFALDRRFDDERHLFGVEWGEDGWELAVPARPRGRNREDLELAVLRAGDDWIAGLLPAGSPERFWRVGTPEGERP